MVPLPLRAIASREGTVIATLIGLLVLNVPSVPMTSRPPSTRVVTRRSRLSSALTKTDWRLPITTLTLLLPARSSLVNAATWRAWVAATPDPVTVVELDEPSNTPETARTMTPAAPRIKQTSAAIHSDEALGVTCRRWTGVGALVTAPPLSLCAHRRENLMRTSNSRGLAARPVSAQQALDSFRRQPKCPPSTPPAHRFDHLLALWQTRTAIEAQAFFAPPQSASAAGADGAECDLPC